MRSLTSNQYVIRNGKLEIKNKINNTSSSNVQSNNSSSNINIIRTSNSKYINSNQNRIS